MKWMRHGPLLAAALLLCSSAIAEVGTHLGTDNTLKNKLLVMAPASVIDHIDPIPQVWARYRNVPDGWILNDGGQSRNDGRPDIAYQPTTGHPVAVWARNEGAHHDIVISEWLGSSWSPFERVAQTVDDEVAPRVFLDASGEAYVVWWVNSNDPRVLLTHRSDSSTAWATPTRVSPPGTTGRRPSVAVFDGTVTVAFERDNPISIGDTEVAVYEETVHDTFVEKQVFVSDLLGDLQIMLHAHGDCRWIDFLSDVDEFAYASFDNSGFQATSQEPLAEETWVGVESARRAIAVRMLAGGGTTPGDSP